MASREGAMANSAGRGALQGAEEVTFDLLAEVLTSRQWAELLKAPLELAAAEGMRGLTQMLVGAGAQMGDALHKAVQGGHRDIVNDLLEKGASVAARDKLDHTPLHVAAHRGEPEMVQLMLLKGADKDARDSTGWTPLYTAVRHGHAAAVLALLAAGADINVRCGPLEWSTVRVAAQRGYLSVLRTMIQHGVNVDAADEDSQTACHVAASENQAGAIDVLVAAGANVNACASRGDRPLHHAARMLSLEAVSALVVHGAHVNAQDNGLDTPLHYAAHNAGVLPRASAVVDHLLRSGADETLVGKHNGNPADVVAWSGIIAGRLVTDVKRVRKLLANAPADRIWRRRGYLVLCRAYPENLYPQQQQQQQEKQQRQEIGTPIGVAPKMARAPASACRESVGGSMVDEKTSGTWAGVVARVLGLREDDIFRKIVGHL